MKHAKSYQTKVVEAPVRAVSEPESVAQALPAGGHGRWLNRTPRGVPAGSTLGGLLAPFWPPGHIKTLPNEQADDARALGLTYVGPAAA